MYIAQQGARYYFVNFTHTEFWFQHNYEDIVCDFYLGTPPENYRDDSFQDHLVPRQE